MQLLLYFSQIENIANLYIQDVSAKSTRLSSDNWVWRSCSGVLRRGFRLVSELREERTYHHGCYTLKPGNMAAVTGPRHRTTASIIIRPD